MCVHQCSFHNLLCVQNIGLNNELKQELGGLERERERERERENDLQYRMKSTLTRPFN